MSNDNFPNENFERYNKLKPRKDALGIALIYGASGIIWILLSDSMLNIFVKENHILMKIQTYKGWLYVAITSLILYYLVRNRMDDIKKVTFKLYDSYENLSATHEELIAIEEELRAQYSELQDSQKAYAESEERYKLAVDGANDGIWDWHLGSDKMYFSHKWKRMLGFEDDEIQNSFEAWEQLLHPEDLDAAKKSIKNFLSETSGVYESTYRLRCKDGSYKWILSRGQALRDDDGKPVRLAGSHTDITESKLSEEKMHFIAFHDPLTGLYNRAMFEKRLGEEIKKAKAFGFKIHLVYLDLDNFKKVNDTLGHESGDKLLIEISLELKKYITETNLFRLSGDEFAMLITDDNNLGKIENIINNLLIALRKPWIIDRYEFYITASIGIASFPKDGQDANTLLKSADAAMYNSKDKGKNQFSYFNKSMNERALYYIDMEKNLTYAIKNEEFKLYYQPQIDLATGDIVGVEALIRWMHPQKGMVSPLEFIPFAEESGFIVEIGEWVILNACKQGKVWRNKGYRPLNISINISAKQFKQENFIDMVTSIIQETDMDVKYLVLEITENTAIYDLECTIDKLTQLKNKGIKIALDDFGVGYSSLNYLKKLPIDILKMDKTFIREMVENSHEESIVKAVIYLAKSMKLTVTAEGIETQKQFEFLKGRRCDEGQGYLFSKPVPAKNIEEILQSNINYANN
ncbi:bifunctional diguanylate cyclase/phosphodiesterase [Brassicibacter mesophilus]|uniref:bifunctional diguanylate cyclase/phosphodiesterase n=1 Tax=Brassicibacter mesophilus TaxID=745119 RepID=UPI003D1B19B7